MKACNLCSILVGSMIGAALCFAFYQIAGLRLFAEVSLLRKAADLVCLVAFISFGIRLAEIFVRLLPSKKTMG